MAGFFVLLVLVFFCFFRSNIITKRYHNPTKFTSRQSDNQTTQLLFAGRGAELPALPVANLGSLDPAAALQLRGW